MDTRIALPDKTELRFHNAEHGICTYTIQKELARGASCIVYDASYINNSGAQKSVRIKECYPFKLSICRNEDGSLVPVESDISDFNRAIAHMQEAFDLGNELFATSGLTNFTSNTVDIYHLNHTVYVVTTYQEGDTLADHNFTSLKDCISIVKSTAGVIAKIHNQGYLYLDLKPENVFALAGTNELVQLFDFDSLIPFAALNKKSGEYEYKISYTKGFSALELQLENQRKLGKYSDVYSIGSILFYLIFGTYPTAPDCELEAVYEYSQSKYAVHSFQDKLYFELTDFFHNTLANYYLDRYSDMQQVIIKLEQMERLADTTVPYIHNSYIPCPKFLAGRDEEIEKLGQWFNQNNCNCLFVTGIGGIGKSSLVRSYFAAHRMDFDTVLYLNYYHSLKQTFTDDKQFWINTVEKNEQEDADDYFRRKLNTAKKLVQSKNTVLIIDNFCMDGLEGIDKLLQLNWKVILITRSNIQPDEYDRIQVGAVQEKKNLYALFEGYLRRQIENGEYPYVDSIIQQVQGHTLVLELIAKQIANSYLSLQEAVRLMQEKGFLALAKEKVSYTKDLSVSTDTVKNIIDTIFTSVHMTEYKRKVLKSVSFFGTLGVDINLFAGFYGLDSMDVIHELTAAGWLTVDSRTLVMHPVIMETVRCWTPTNNFREAACHIMDGLCKALENGTDPYLRLSEEFVICCCKESVLKETEICQRLLYMTVIHMPRHREEFILENAAALLTNNGHLNGAEIIRLSDLITGIYEERRDFENARQVLKKIRPAIALFHDIHITGQYYDLWAGFYDAKLDGKYVPESTNEEQIFTLLMKSIDKSIKYMRKSRHTDGRILLGEYLSAKANILIRSMPEKKKKILHLLGQVKDILKKEGLYDSKLARNYYLACAWYDTYVKPQFESAVQNLKRAYDIEVKTGCHELDLIDDILIPSANIFLEFGECEKSAEILRHGISLCEENEEIISFVRKKEELESYWSAIPKLL